MHEEKFIEPFIDFIEKNFDSTQHKYIIKRSEKFKSKSRKNLTFVEEKLSKLKELLIYTRHLNSAEKIFLHGLFNNAILIILFMQPWLLKKCYWLIWGGDLYYYQNRPKSFYHDMLEKVRAFVIRRIGNFITYIKGDYELTQKWYGSRGKYCECLMYPSNLYKEYVVPNKLGDAINMMVGNSADPTNNHVEVFKILSSYKGENINIYCPLSYGPDDYAKKIAKVGKDLFGEKYVPLIDFMPFEEYIKLLGQIDFAIFAHKRQQAMGNIISLLGLGKKVYMRSDITPWAMLNSLGINVYDLEKFNIEPMDLHQIKENMNIVKENFTEKRLFCQWRSIFGE